MHRRDEEYRVSALDEALADARAAVAGLLDAARARGLALRAPPEQPDPRTCCGRGCHPCMFTYYFEAHEGWVAEAGAILGAGGAP